MDIRENIRIASEYGNKFAYDGCHKIYILRTEEEEKESKENGYKVLDIKELKKIYDNSCPLRFISSWDLKIRFIPQ